MNLLKYTAITFIVIAASATDAAPSYLTGRSLRDTIKGQTLIAKDWAEFYQSDGTIIGKVRYLGIRDYTGKWEALENRICYSYPRKDQDRCSRLTLDGNTITHYDLSGKQKKDGVAHRFPGNSLDQFK
ncbi:hypothetical protein [Floridanema evergladense]|uniref:Uncharacterized protein n=1 Tax=Floridaenema evergladense BLCC-F167 TaxID=3153639 RepID=A0ABV4WN58_9CYAN